MGERSLEIAWKLMAIDQFEVLVLGILLIGGPEVIPTFAGWIANYPALAGPLKLTYGWIGLLMIDMAILAIAVSCTSFRKGEKWSWYALLAWGLIGWVGTIAFHQVLFPPPEPPQIANAIGIILFIIAIMLSAKPILGKS